MQEIDFNSVAGGANYYAHYDPTTSHPSSAPPEPICSSALPHQQKQMPHQLHHYPLSSASRQRSLRRPPTSSNVTPTAQSSKPFSPIGVVSQSFAAPLRPTTLQEFQEALRKLPLDDPNIEERIRSMVTHLSPEAFSAVEPVRLQSSSAQHFVECILKMKQRSVRQGFEVSLEEFQRKVKHHLKNQGTLQDHVVEHMIGELGPQTQPIVRQLYLFRSSGEDFVKRLDSVKLPGEDSIVFTRPILSAVVDYLCELDNSVALVPFFDVVQTDITPKIRFILAEWLFDVSARFKFCKETIFLALALTDRYFSIQRVARGEAQLVGVAALVLAAKYEEVYPPDMKDYEYMSANALHKTDILRMERQLFVRLQFGVTIATINSIATALVAEQDPVSTPVQTALVHYLCTVMAVSTHLGQYSQAHLAAAVVYISRIWTDVPTTQAPSVEVQRLLSVVVVQLQSISPSNRLGATVYAYFSQSAQHSVATLPIPQRVVDLAPQWPTPVSPVGTGSIN